MDSKKIGEYIQIKRKEIGLTQVQLSEKLGITSKAISKWETGVAIPDVALFTSLTKALNITIEELLQGEDNKVVPVKKKKINITTILTIIIFLLIILSCSLVIYFKNNYSKVEVYKIESANNNFHVEGNLMNIDGKSYLSIAGVEYVGNELNLLDSVYDFEYELYYREKLVFKSGKQINNDINKNYILKNEFSSVSLLSDEITDDIFLLNDTGFYLRIKYLNNDLKTKNIDVILKIIC